MNIQRYKRKRRISLYPETVNGSESHLSNQMKLASTEDGDVIIQLASGSRWAFKHKDFQRALDYLFDDGGVK